MSVKIFNQKGDQVFPSMGTASETNLGVIRSTRVSSQVKFQQPVTITPAGYVYNGLSIIEVEEDGFFVVDKNMNAVFSSRNVVSNTSGSSSSSSSSITPAAPSDVAGILSRLSAAEANIAAIQDRLGGVTIEIQN